LSGRVRWPAICPSPARASGVFTIPRAGVVSIECWIWCCFAGSCCAAVNTHPGGASSADFGGAYPARVDGTLPDLRYVSEIQVPLAPGYCPGRFRLRVIVAKIRRRATFGVAFLHTASSANSRFVAIAAIPECIVWSCIDRLFGAQHNPFNAQHFVGAATETGDRYVVNSQQFPGRGRL